MNETPRQNSEEQGCNRADILTRFQPGQSGNPGGLPKGTSLTSTLRALLDDEAIKEKLVRSMVTQAARGNPAAIKMVFDRHDGPVVQDVKLTIDTISYQGLQALFEEYGHAWNETDVAGIARGLGVSAAVAERLAAAVGDKLFEAFWSRLEQRMLAGAHGLHRADE